MAQGEGSTRIEWPHGSGVVAEYDLYEQGVLRELVEACERGEFSEAQLGREVGLLHSLKAAFDGRIRPSDDGDDDRAGEVLEFPPPDSAFQIPPRAVDLLEAHDPQLRIA